MSDTNDKNRIRRKTVSSKSRDKTENKRSRTRSDEKTKLKIKKQVSSGSGLNYTSKKSKKSIREDNVVDFDSYRSRDRYARVNDVREYDSEEYEDDYRERSGIFRVIRKLVIFVLVVTVILGSVGFLYVKIGRAHV